jgi:hypothetical protein
LFFVGVILTIWWPFLWKVPATAAVIFVAIVIMETLTEFRKKLGK